MIFEWVLSGLYVVAVVCTVVLGFAMQRLQRGIDASIARKMEFLNECSETWKRCTALNDETMRTLDKIKRVKDGEGWKRG